MKEAKTKATFDSPSFSLEERLFFEDIEAGQKPDASEKERKKAEEASIAIANLYLPYATAFIKKEFYYLDEATRQDLIQEGWLTMWVYAKSFDLSRGVKFSTYIYRYLKKACQNFLKANDLTSDSISETRSAEEDNEEESLPELTDLLPALTPRQKEAIGYRFGLFGQEEKRTYKKIGEAMGISDEAARVLVLTAIGKMKGAAGGK